MQGYIALHRKIINWEWWDDHNTTRLFLYILLNTNHKDKKWRGVLIKKGQFLTSLNSLKKGTGLSVKKIRTSLNKLKSTHEVTIETTNRNTVISVVKWGDYQTLRNGKGKQNDTPQDTQRANKGQTKGKQRATTNNEYNVNNDKKGEREHAPRKSKFSSRKEIDELVLQDIADNYQVPIAFTRDCWDSAQNWLDAKGKVQKNYKAFLCNWVKRERADWIIKQKRLNNSRMRGGVMDATDL